ncbi:BREX-1 system adenine-specific DNA-methyltransferase PglX [Pseudoalteromonas sp. CO325X]|uniref:BREX-1 system adenine-specific DNA-methyltransferase PglX n=1 Tax=Pseudoalteromonas sp. CO325X TaxID=1777262 RepID=UPI001023CC8F|nr:BREX-1 system adenine-specific DNA-methyltransferase PglX [Pseudoalteromonas sp. CO325X]RZF81837.1 BREX-1 system adenine-specific DNA-methyltransferase PglX [Pseudoalteromonas sp. CO325X]
MNTAKLKTYAPQARREFITAVSKQLNQLGIYSDKQISEVKQEGSVLLIEGKTFEPSVKTARERLVKKVQAMGYNQLVEQVAYTWFNRLCAIRYMEIHDYLGHGFRVLSHPDNPKGFEIIDHAQDAADELGLDRSRIIELKLAGNKDEELYRELLLGQCHKLHEAMPFLFDALDDETELLLPDNLTRTDSILRGLVDGIPEEDWQQVEVIGWLYQFYISEKKDQVIGKVVKSEDIPAATQLFTPNWIVKYLVQNSVGRQWLQTYPDSAIKLQMEYYIEPAEQSDEVNQRLKAITPESIEPETIKVLDPACGSGHILIEAYNVLKAIYEERGFRSRDIPKMILENNLYGLDIDDRAAQLSGFALMMMARDDDKRIFARNVRLNVLSLQESNHIDLPTLWKALNLSGSWQSGTSQGLFSDDEQDLSSFNADDCMDAGGRATQDAKADNRYQLLKRTLARFTQAKTFGSLIDVPSDEHEQLKELLSTLVELQESGDSMQKSAAKQLIEFVHQALILSTRYDAVIANPPYMGSKYQTAEVKKFLKDNFKGYEKDLFSAYIIRNLQLAKEHGQLGFMTPFVWMFLSTYEQLRRKLIDDEIISTLIQLEYSGFDGATVPICTFTLTKGHVPEYLGSYIKLSDFRGAANQGPKTLEAIANTGCGWFYKAKPDNFNKIPGSPIAYWVSKAVVNIYEESPKAGEISQAAVGLQTGDNDQFMRFWYEIDYSKFSDKFKNTDETIGSEKKWVPYNKGGSYRKWYGNREYVVNWQNDGKEIRSFKDHNGKLRSRPQNTQFYFREGITWSEITSSWKSFRYNEAGSISDVKGQSAYFCSKSELVSTLCWLNSNVVELLTKIQNPTLSFQSGDYKNLPLPALDDEIIPLGEKAISLAQKDWDSFETSERFGKSPLLSDSFRIKESYYKYFNHSKGETDQLRELEEKINSYLVIKLKLDEDIKSSVLEEQVTLKANPIYRYGAIENASVKFKSETICELLSYSIGCMIGRYSVDREGLVYAHSGNDGFDKLVAEGAYKSYPADDDGIIPLTDQEWFKDDATNRFREFVQVVWGEEHLQENLDFVAESLCLNAIKPLSKKGHSESALETIRRYLSTQFYKDHLKTYKKRPIYWLFSSGKQKAFECLVYLHRYNEGTLSRMRTEYVTPLLGKYDAYAEQLEKQIETADSTSEANRFKKELDALIKKQVELREFDDKLKHYADMRISLDLDDGVKVNYGKFGDLLAEVKAVTGKKPEVN